MDIQTQNSPSMHQEEGFARFHNGESLELSGREAVDISLYPGRLIVVEGTDGAGRSTQVALLREWLESHGFAVAHTALTRSRLAAEGLQKAKQGHTLSHLTMDLLYATDFADRLDNFILPALRGGFVVLTDRYIYSTMARSIVRGGDPQWIRDVYQFAPRPHAVFHLKIDLEYLIPRVLARGGFDYWESGMDCQGENDIYRSFRQYQDRLLRVFDELAEEYDLRVVDANLPVRQVYQTLKDGILEVVSTMTGARV